MNTRLTLTTVIGLAMLFCALFVVGCGGENTGYLIRPVPLDDRLEESTVRRDPGLFVFDKIAIIDVDGIILNMRGSPVLGSGENPVSLFIEKLDKAASDSSVKAVVLRINSPGGGVTASDIMYQRLVRFRQEKPVPVVASISDLGASGGYYIACGADSIYAMPSSITGSIGVIVHLFSIAGTMEKLGIESKAITSGRFKDVASPFKPISKEDQALLQKLVDEYYEDFLAVVQAGRPKLSPQKIRELADGRVYTGEQAKANGLVDNLGYVEDAIAGAKALSGSSRVRVVMYHRPLTSRNNSYATASVSDIKFDMKGDVSSAMQLLQPQFLYLWTGTTPTKP